MRIVYPGAAGPSVDAAVRALTPGGEVYLVSSASTALDALAAGDAARALLPLEDTASGSIPGVLDALADHAERGGIRVVAERWERDGDTHTRFLMAAPATAAASGADKTSLVLTPSEQVPNALFRALTAFVGRRLAVLRIEPRPRAGQPGRYRYHVDVEGDDARDPLAAGLTDAAAFCERLVVLGSYRAHHPA